MNCVKLRQKEFPSSWKRGGHGQQTNRDKNWNETWILPRFVWKCDIFYPRQKRV